MTETIPTGETREVIADADPRGSYRLSVENGRVVIGKTQREAARGNGDRLSKFNYARVKVGEASESVWVHNPTDSDVELNIRKSGFLLDFFGSTTQESATERDEREGNVVISEETQVTLDPESTLNTLATVDVDSDTFGNDVRRVLLTAVYVQPNGHVADRGSVKVEVDRYYGTFNTTWAATGTLEDSPIQIPDGARPSARVDNDQHFSLRAQNSGFDTLDLDVRLVFRVIE